MGVQGAHLPNEHKRNKQVKMKVITGGLMLSRFIQSHSNQRLPATEEASS